MDLSDEVAAYKAEFAYSYSQVGNNSKSASSFSQINSGFVQSIKDSKGTPVYNKHRLIPININSTVLDLIKAYPYDKARLNTLPAETTIKSFSDAIYK